MKIRMIRKATTFLCMVLVLTMGTTSQVQAATDVPYDTYNYDYREYIVHTPAAYVPAGSISAVSFGETAFSNPQDMVVGKNGYVYVADTGNNRIVVLNNKMDQLITVIENFQNGDTLDTFNKPSGVAVSDSNQLYIADTENKRVVVLEDGKLVKIFENPQSDLLDESFQFKPLKVCVDYADRVYCIANGVFEGIMAFESNGSFTGYYGTINATLTLEEKFWIRFSTKAERSKQQLYIQTEFTGMDLDQDGFLYATNYDTSGTQAIRRLNPKGQDVIVLPENNKLAGDIYSMGTTLYSGPSTIVDVVYRGKGIYSVIDSKRGRVFTYDHEGSLLYIFGGLGSQAGTFRIPVAIESIDDNLLVLDSYRGEILKFSETRYGELINDAVELRYDGDEKQAVDKWKEVLKYDENFELANVGIGKAYLTTGDNEQAMKFLKLGMSQRYYSIAYKRYRNDILKENLGYILTGGIVLIVGVRVALSTRRKRKGQEGKEALL